ncbi:hypothetical protein QYM36_005328 [Artemia franciscana]|uniref:Uncharacterized protein n=1 Tax=Artemia franciscana TaxID=6661 RepID=A0AA88HX81_ARTSF|nr:hypothetical protein QYM36_005328 [Artemia franciscana]
MKGLIKTIWKAKQAIGLLTGIGASFMYMKSHWHDSRNPNENDTPKEEPPKIVIKGPNIYIFNNIGIICSLESPAPGQSPKTDPRDGK